MKRTLIILALLTSLSVFNAKAEKADSCFSVQVDLANRWIWRGVAYSEAPVIQPSLGYANEKWNVSVWGSYPIERRAYSEIDFILEYQLTSKLKLGFVDYFAINDSTGAKHGFFDMNRKTTMHMFDVYCVYQPVEKIPLSFLYSLWFWGADRKAITKEQNFSSYLEAKYEKEYGKVTASAFAGMTLWEGFYASRAAVVNVGVGLSKPITLGNKISIPAKIEFVLNPEMQNAYINAIITLK
ncbi:MAG: hypothetical protein A2W90_10955 [Bacteroidetes bacterium GWF2_42_66]|nr:MAG: hypothetical protein A2W92_09945 [Bacteroidetes bacterium GWA2_42_15]OFY01904.1 MAG: hypothetical protein A2W89_23615 [Bacteroidetes bacterium GWE2_42_39]OFY44800.1 MAG: hypothetical protein A2W90_10955 [Bacteroidetes bacterium GWF2_42_66]HBL75927.1 hypothetical protein [Prolixibacteraceae bacterium]HCR89174.1 hypothetical protein [Prolixibacteraceae bacterium]